ncbi:MAG: tetratricopeptide repeat protein [Synechocystis sp.]|nr:tetratricopeptide repeat protein [Synechocystis sp.]
MASTKEIVQKTFIIASGVAFLGMMTLPMLSIFKGDSNSPPPSNASAPNQPPTAEERAKIAAIADGYAKVLEREPDNPNALQGLVEARLQLGDLPGAIPPLEKLTELYPEQEPLKQLLTVIKQQVAQPNAPTPPGAVPSPPPDQP